MKVAIGQYNHAGSERPVVMHLDPEDTWSLDYTLAIIIAPCLIQLKETSHGSFMVADDHVPPELQRGKYVKSVYDYDDNWDARWEYILDEMIFAFETIRDTDDMDWSEMDEFRVNRGLKFFGKYYRSLWD